MAVIQGRTLEQIRVAVGLNLGAVKLITSADTGSATTFKTNGLFTATDDHRGKWLRFTGPTNNDGSTARVTDSSISSEQTTLTMKNILAAALTTPVAGDTAELWENRFDPTVIHDYINQALIDLTGRAYDPEESLALHGDGRQLRFDIPTEFAMLSGVFYRTSVESKEIHDATTEWNEAAAPANVTRAVDTKDYKKATASNKFTIAGAFTTGLVSSKAISSLDLSGYDYVEFWVKSTIATVAGDFTILLDDSAVCASALETLSIPALVADTWTFVHVALANPELDTAIISVGLNAANNIAANVIWVNDVRAVRDDTAVWRRLSERSWRIDKEARDLVLTPDARSVIGNRLIKLVGGDKPALLSADATACEVDDEFVIARATELALASAGDSRAPYWAQKAAIAKRGLSPLVGVHVVG